MELQLAFDMVEKDKALEIVKDLQELVDIVELGTPFSFIHSIDTVAEFKKAAPGVKILSDFKIMDGGYGIAKIAYDAGADITTVSGRTWDDTIRQAIQSARDHGKQILVDMMGVPDEQIEERGAQLDAMEPDYICIHRAVSVSASSSPEAPLRSLRKVAKHAKVAVAGGINLETLSAVTACGPDLVIIGGAIVNAENPRKTAEQMRKIMEKNNG